MSDGIYAALRLLEILSHSGQSISELLADLPQGYNTPEIRMDCPDAKKFAVVEQVKQALAAEGGGELSDIDGVRVSYPDGSWGLARASNTGPIIVLRFEAQTPERLQELKGHVEGLVANATASA